MEFNLGWLLGKDSEWGDVISLRTDGQNDPNYKN